MCAGQKTAPQFSLRAELLGGLSIFCVFALVWGTLFQTLGVWYFFVAGCGLLGLGLLKSGDKSYLWLGLPILYIFSTRFGRAYSFFHLWPEHYALVILLSGLAPYLLHLKFPRYVIPVLVIVTALVGLADLLLQGNGQPIFSDDHASFLYRLQLLKENFPFIPFYNPQWNAGYDAREFFPSGVLNFFLIFAPFIYLLPVKLIYSTLVGLLLFALAPTLNWWATYLVVRNKRASWLTAMITISGSTLWYKWGLSYGTLGFATSLCLLPLTLVLLAQFLEEQHSVFRDYFVFPVCATLTLLWPLAGVILLPTLLWQLPAALKALRDSRTRWTLVILLCLNLPWMLLFLSNSPVAQFVSATPDRSMKEIHSPKNLMSFSPDTMFQIGVAAGQTINPLLVLGLVPGLLLLGTTKKAKFVCATLGWCLCMGICISQLKPQLELERMLVAFLMIATIPAGVGLAHLLDEYLGDYLPARLLCVPIWGILLASPLWLHCVLANEGSEKIFFASNVTHSLAQAISTHAGSGRVLMAGFTLHTLEGGHVAPLPYLSKVPMVASGFYHNKWRYEDVIPTEFREQGKKGVLEFLDLMNITAIVTHDGFWRRWFKKRKKLFNKVFELDRFTIYVRNNVEPSYFLSGRGEILSQNSNSVKVRVSSAKAVLKFKYFDFLHSETCKLGPFKVSPSLYFIELQQCEAEASITIASRSPLKRLLPSVSSIQQSSF